MHSVLYYLPFTIDAGIYFFVFLSMIPRCDISIAERKHRPRHNCYCVLHVSPIAKAIITYTKTYMKKDNLKTSH